MLSASMRRHVERIDEALAWAGGRRRAAVREQRAGRSEGGRLSASSLLLSSLAGRGFFISRDDERFYGHAIRRRASRDDVTSHMGTARAAANGGQTTTVGRIFLPAVQRCLWGTSWFLLVRGRQQHSEHFAGRGWSPVGGAHSEHFSEHFRRLGGVLSVGQGGAARSTTRGVGAIPVE
jgi:hypothetical protein